MRLYGIIVKNIFMDEKMLDETCLELIGGIINTQKDLVVVFKDEMPILTNEAFMSFLGVKSFDEYISDFSSFVEHFAMHPSYFNKEKIQNTESWFDAILRLESKDRIVSMINIRYEPRAFMVKLLSLGEFKVVSFEDITQDLIKRIMIENNANIDKKSGAYAKEYFLQVQKNFEDAASFNDKIIGLSFITICGDMDKEIIKNFVIDFKSMIRQDDMFVRWSEDKFIFVYLVDNEVNVKLVVSKLNDMISTKLPSSLNYSYTSTFQKNGEKISKLLEIVIS